MQENFAGERGGSQKNATYNGKREDGNEGVSEEFGSYSFFQSGRRTVIFSPFPYLVPNSPLSKSMIHAAVSFTRTVYVPSSYLTVLLRE